MEPTWVEIYLPSRLYPRIGWAALAGALICALCGLRAPLAFIPGALCAMTSGLLFWLWKRPPIRLGETQFNIGERAIAWREVREINHSRFVSPLILNIKLTNSRHKVMIYPGEPERIEKLMWHLRKNSYMATFDGVSHRDYWAWAAVAQARGENPPAEQPVRMVSSDEEDEIERMYQRLKTVGRLDTRSPESKTPDED
ncbi:MAG: hypothetical protein JO340_08780 [Acidobacteriaceae bacterium]|nr:hypothetical protein [Acidobacteriaceae bacterium]